MPVNASKPLLLALTRATRRVSTATAMARIVVVVLACALAACSGGGGDSTGTTGDGDDDDATSGGMGFTPTTPSDLCELAPLVGPGRWYGALSTNAELLGGVCEMGGPDAFLRVSADKRVDLQVFARGEGFTPRVEIIGDACTHDPSLGCALDGTAGLTVRDLLPGSTVHIVVGASPDEPLLGQSDTTTMPYYVDIVTTRVLAAGERCRPEVLGRCIAGTVCAPASEDEDGGQVPDPAAAEPVWRCVEVTADTCADAEEVDLAGTLTTLEFAGPPAQSDAHHHSCTGVDLVERVFQLRLPENPDGTESLNIRTDAPGVGLAVRTPGCLLDHELACSAPAEDGAEVTIVDFAALAQSGAQPYLFVEWPADGPAEIADGFVVELVRG